MSERNREADVLDQIDLLVNESLARPIVDDYSADRYPKCSACHHDWHGIRCMCGCPASEGEVLVTGTEMNPRWTTSTGQFTVRPERRDIDWSVNIPEDPHVTAADWFDGTVSIPPELQFPRNVIPAAPVWLTQMIDHTLSYVQDMLGAVSGLPPETEIEPGYTINDLMAMRDQWWANRPYGYGIPEAAGPYSYQEQFAPIREPRQLQFPRSYGEPRVRLWDAQMQLIGEVQTPVMMYPPDGGEPYQATLEITASDNSLTVLSVPLYTPPLSACTDLLPYCGPEDTLRRVQAGEDVSAEDMVTDQSLWIVEGVERRTFERIKYFAVAEDEPEPRCRICGTGLRTGLLNMPDPLMPGDLPTSDELCERCRS